MLNFSLRFVCVGLLSFGIFFEPYTQEAQAASKTKISAAQAKQKAKIAALKKKRKAFKQKLCKKLNKGKNNARCTIRAASLSPIHYLQVYNVNTDQRDGPFFSGSTITTAQSLCVNVDSMSKLVFHYAGRSFTSKRDNAWLPFCMAGASGTNVLPLGLAAGKYHVVIDFYNASNQFSGYREIDVVVGSTLINPVATATNTPMSAVTRTVVPVVTATKTPTVTPTRTPTPVITSVVQPTTAPGSAPSPIIRTINDLNAQGEVTGTAPLALFVQGVKMFTDYPQYDTCLYMYGNNERALSVSEGEQVDNCLTQVQNSFMAENRAMLGGVGSEMTSNFMWNFGHAAGGRRNVQSGFSAGYLYQNPGRYVVTLQVTNQSKKVATKQLIVNVSAPNRTVYYVDAATGNDANTGRSEGAAFRSFSRVSRLLNEQPNNTEIRFRRGQTFGMGIQGVGGNPGSSATIKGNNVVITAFGYGDAPKIVWNNGLAPYQSIFTVEYTAKDVHFSNLAVMADVYAITGNANYKEKDNIPTGFYHGGKRISASNIEFGHITNAFQGAQKIINSSTGQRDRTKGLLIQDCKDLGTTSIHGYFSWVGGSQNVVFLENTIRNSTREHIVRSAEWSGPLAASYNTFSNLSYENAGDNYDGAKGVFVMQNGVFNSINNNTISFGPSGTGPLDAIDYVNGVPVLRGNRGHTTRFSTYEGNTMLGMLYIRHGSHHVRISNNHINIGQDNGDSPFTAGIAVESKSERNLFNRVVKNLTIAHNTIYARHDSVGKNSMHLKAGAENVTIRNNLYLAVDSHVGAYGGAAITLYGERTAQGVIFPSLSDIDCNTFPLPGYIGNTPHNITRDGVAFVGVYGENNFLPVTQYEQALAGYRLPSPNVDRFRYVSFTAQGSPSVYTPDAAEKSQLQCPQVLGVFTDYRTSKLRSGATATAGAVELN